MKRIFIICSLFSILFSSNCEANLGNIQQQEVCNKSDQSKDDWIRKIEEYFAKNGTLQSEIEQIDHKGNVSHGKVWLKRKSGYMKIQYSEPFEKVILIKDGRVTQYDPELNEKTETSIHSSPLSFLLDKFLDLKKNISVHSVAKQGDEIFIKLIKKNDDSDGAIMLIFSKNDFKLKGWTILSSNKDIFCNFVHVQLISTDTKSEISDSVFTLSSK